MKSPQVMRKYLRRFVVGHARRGALRNNGLNFIVMLQREFNRLETFYSNPTCGSRGDQMALSCTTIACFESQKDGKKDRRNI